MPQSLVSFVLLWVGALLAILGFVLLWYYARETKRKRLRFAVKSKAVSVDDMHNYKWIIYLFISNDSYIHPISVWDPILRICRGSYRMEKHHIGNFQPLYMLPRHQIEVELCFVSLGGLDGMPGTYESTVLLLQGGDKFYEIPVDVYPVMRLFSGAET